MARYDVFPNPGNATAPYLLDVQNDLLDGLATRVVAPLGLPSAYRARFPDLNPCLVVGGEEFVLMTHLLAAVPIAELSRPVTSLAAEHDTVLRALDMLFQGF
ncbi:MAG TPA: CcdB family protein [Azospirillaceae bacterium]|nr:CcdB family protein [Azospirillaceae bacterium]